MARNVVRQWKMLEIIFLIIIIALIALNSFTIWFYQRQVQTLIDKTLSRNYAEYVQSKNLEQADHFPNGSTQEKPHVEDDQVLAELNSILG